MSYKKLTSAVMALIMAASMTAIAVNAEEPDDAALAGAGTEETQAPEAPVATSAQILTTAAPITTTAATTTRIKVAGETGYQTEPQSETAETETDAENSQETERDLTETYPSYTTTAIGSTATAIKNTTGSETETTTAATTTATAVASTEKVSSDKLAAPKVSDFSTYQLEGADGTNAVISWDAVAGADGYQVYRIGVAENDPDIPTAYTFDVKGTSYQTGASNAYKETVKVRAFQLVNGEKVYGPWSASKTVYLNGMKPETTTAKSTKKTEKSTTKAASKDSDKSESPKTGDSANIPAVAGAASAAMVAGLAAMKKKRK